MKTVSNIQYYVKLLCFSLIAVLSASQAQAQQNKSERIITLTTSGSVKVKPDTAHINTAVETMDKSAQTAVKKNSEAMSRVIKALKSRGIRNNDIQTTNFSVRPEYENYSSNKRKRNPDIIGYRVINNLRITINKIDDLGDILDEVVKLGSNRIGGISFSVKKSDQILDKARRLAMKKAIKRARLYTSAAGARLGKVITIRENHGYNPAPRVTNMRAFKSASPVPIQAGAQDLTVQITVSWQIVR